MIANAVAFFGSLLFVKETFFYTPPPHTMPDFSGLYLLPLYIGWNIVVLCLLVAVIVSGIRHGLSVFESDISLFVAAVVSILSVALNVYIVVSVIVLEV